MSYLRTPLRWAAIAALVISLGLGFYFAGRIAFRHWALVILILYFAGGAVVALGALVGHSSALRQSADYGLLQVLGDAALRKSSVFDRWRVLIATRLLFACALLAWPAGVGLALLLRMKLQRMPTQKEAAMYRQLGAYDITVEPLFILGCAHLAAIALIFSSQPRVYFVIFAWTTVAYVICLCLGMIAAPGAVAQRARRAAGNPHFRAIFLALSLVAVSIFSLTIISFEGQLSRSNLASIVRALSSQLDSAKELFSGRPVSTPILLTGAMGALLVSATIRGLISIRAFRRTDDDILTIAAAKAALGKPSSALAALALVTNQTPGSLSLKAICLLCIDRQLEAVAVWKKRELLLAGSSAQFGDDQIRLFIQEAAAYPIAEPSILRFVRFWIEQSPSEVVFALVSLQLVVFDRASPGSILTMLREAAALEKYPTISARLMIQSDDIAGSTAFVSTLAPQSGSLEFMRVTTLLLIGILGPTSESEDAAFFEAWCAENLESLATLESSLHSFDELAIALESVNLLAELSERFNSTQGEALRFLVTTMSARWKAVAPDKEVMEAILDQASFRRFRTESL